MSTPVSSLVSYARPWLDGRWWIEPWMIDAQSRGTYIWWRWDPKMLTYCRLSVRDGRGNYIDDRRDEEIPRLVFSCFGIDSRFLSRYLLQIPSLKSKGQAGQSQIKFRLLSIFSMASSRFRGKALALRNQHPTHQIHLQPQPRPLLPSSYLSKGRRATDNPNVILE